MIYDASVIIVAQGTKRARIDGVDFDYSPARYLILPVALPIGAQIIDASPSRPFLSFAIQIDPVMLGELASAIDPSSPGPLAAVRGIAVSETTDEILEAAVRLLSCLDSETDCRILAPHIKREILYRILTGPQGQLLRGVGNRDSRLGQIARALNVIHTQYPQHIEIAELAQEAHMSTSTFYETFKAVTSFPPLQYLKEIRLTRARQIMLWEGCTAQRAASQVGYASASQFSREFKRRFGRSPGEERAWALETGELQGARPY
jgi:AraC-like DNA-binding protein